MIQAPAGRGSELRDPAGALGHDQALLGPGPLADGSEGIAERRSSFAMPGSGCGGQALPEAGPDARQGYELRAASASRGTLARSDHSG